MTLASELAELFIDTVTLAVFVSANGYGGATYDDAGAKTVKARIEHGAKKVIDARIDGGGREVVSMTRVFLKPTATDGAAIAPKVTDKVTLPAGYSPQVPPIIRVDRQNDEAGLHHWELSV